jgi:NAD(P)-dependent dehydrogenase (short-subunit alcohol dehydrogenase family)
VDTRLDGKRAAVTAGAGGAGRVIASRLAAEGAEVFVCDIDAGALAALPQGITGVRVDVADPEQVDSWIEPIARDGIDILVNNAGIAGPTAPIEDIGVENWRECLAVCLDSQFFCARRVIPFMKARKAGAIVNISSTAGLMGMPNRAPYVAAKFAVIGLTKTLAMELGPFNIRVNAIAPGSITGDRMDRVIAAHAKAEGISKEHVRAIYTQGTSMQTFVEADEIADMVVYLCSERGKHISGQVIAVDGHTETLYPRTLT